MRTYNFPEEIMLILKIEPLAANMGVILRSVCAIYRISINKQLLTNNV
jgi:hypothetical protein